MKYDRQRTKNAYACVESCSVTVAAAAQHDSTGVTAALGALLPLWHRASGSEEDFILFVLKTAVDFCYVVSSV